ncbi:restriction endonuclease subunit S [Daejeonella lutea]|uniref:Type I restriction enzyme, S subunit n=1 Tax=Daejeonella lutea TaxID=572036 RepID=A0A1T5B2B0_9SPHI|nr:restriction endonuclease subunit S [Daejeonella lutea]SKB41013.1 type I restriction enzyme, S subunit [Daejeonella lutea]
MASEMNLKSFIDEQISGDWGKPEEILYNNNLVYCIRGADINDVNLGVYHKLPKRFIHESKLKGLLRNGDLVIEISGGSPSQSTGRVAFISNDDKRLICSNFCRGLRIKVDQNSKYYYYLLKNIYNSNIFFNFESKTSGIKNLLFDTAFENIKVKKRDLLSQQKIASVLSALDDKIELNSKINAELEAMAKTLYDYWFVQFDFPDVDNKPYKSSGGEMIYNEVLKRDIPKGWEVSVFNDWVAKTKTGDWGREEIEGNYTERVYCVRGADINGLNGKGEVKAPERYILKSNLSKTLRPNDFIIEISGGSPVQSTGRIALLTEATFERFESNVICSNFCKAISLKDEKYVFNFLQEWKRLYNANVFFSFEGKTSGIKNFLYDSFMDTYRIVKPAKDIAENYYSYVQSLENKKQSNLKQNQQLASLRDWLLPMLMNGQVKVAGADEEVVRELGMVAEDPVSYNVCNDEI